LENFYTGRSRKKKNGSEDMEGNPGTGKEVD